MKDRQKLDGSNIHGFYDGIFFLGDYTRLHSADYFISLMIYDQINYLIDRKLDKLESRCIREYYYNHKSQEEIATLIDYDRSYVSKLLKSGREKLLGYLLKLKENAKDDDEGVEKL